MMSIVVASISIFFVIPIVSLETTTMVVTMMFVVASSTRIVPRFMTLVCILRERPLERSFRMVFVNIQLSLPVFSLLDVVLQYDSLI